MIFLKYEAEVATHGAFTQGAFVIVFLTDLLHDFGLLLDRLNILMVIYHILHSFLNNGKRSLKFGVNVGNTIVH